MQDLKQTYIKIIDALQIDDPVVDQLKAFINTYKADNLDEFNLFVLSLIQFLKEYKTLRVKAGGYDRITQTRQTYKNRLDNIREEYKMAREMPLDILAPATDTKLATEDLEKELEGMEDIED
jgi:hypothetical protein